MLPCLKLRNFICRPSGGYPASTKTKSTPQMTILADSATPEDFNLLDTFGPRSGTPTAR